MRGRADYSVGTLTKCILVEIPTEQFTNPALLGTEMIQAIWHRLLRDEGIGREWLVSMGRRDALERVAHFLCEIRFRLEAVGLVNNDQFAMQFTQAELGDVLGMSCVHVNRTLQQLRRTGLIDSSGGTMSILDILTLETIAGFDPTYLQI